MKKVVLLVLTAVILMSALSVFASAATLTGNKLELLTYAKTLNSKDVPVAKAYYNKLENFLLRLDSVSDAELAAFKGKVDEAQAVVDKENGEQDIQKFAKENQKAVLKIASEAVEIFEGYNLSYDKATKKATLYFEQNKIDEIVISDMFATTGLSVNYIIIASVAALIIAGAAIALGMKKVNAK